ncbi:Ankyrin-1 [Geodia barretti]|uniref:Ankyrin-1 n=1 Tax=Geodia barretti TaxID=519541 RepID=A0AA35XDK9_GEOBA|nr:Ankyrin-1 [Geodia barretti]
MSMRDRSGPWTLAGVLAAGLLAITWASPASGQPVDGTLADAARQGAVETVADLLEAGADVDAAGSDGTTALHWAVQRDDRPLARRLIAAGARVEAANRYGVTPLALAAANGSAPLAAALLDAGADPEAASPGGDTPLMLAARTGRPDVLRLLLEAGADVHATESWSRTPDVGRRRGHADAVLRAHRGRRRTSSPVGRAAHAAAVRGAGGTHRRGRGPAGGRANIHGAARDGSTPLALAVVNAHYELAGRLLELGADPNLPDPRGSVLHALAWIRRPGSGRPPLPTGALDSLDLARALLEAGADPDVHIDWREIPFEVDLGIVRPPPGISVGRNFLSFVGATPFYLAAKHADVDLMRLLVRHGADPLTPTHQRVTPLMAAAGVGFWDGESPGPLNGTPEQIRLEAIKLAIELGNDLHAATDFGDTPLAGEGRALLLRHPLNLAELDAQRDRGDMRWGGSTALHGAAMIGSNLIVQYLLEQGADIDAPNTLGWTPLMVAEGVFVANTEKAWPDTVTLLRELGAGSN